MVDMALLALDYKYVTEDYIREWKTSSSSHSLQLQVPPARFLYELCWTVVRGDLPVNKWKVALESVEFCDTFAKEETSFLLADTIAHMGQEINFQGELRTHLVDLAKWLVENGLVSMRLLQERCEAEFLWEAEMIKIKATDLKSKEVRVNTRLLYQQTKFNLLREESEGYAKLVTLLSQQGPDGLTRETAPIVISTIKSLIGQFDLDPNRVFDIVLECFELQPKNHAFLELIPLFPKSHTSHILGFKFQYYQRPEVKTAVPDGLNILAAILIKADFIDLDSVYAHLMPRDEDAIAEYEIISRRRLDEANKIGKINLAATGKDLMEEEKPGDVTIDLYAALDMENEAILERLQELLTNQKLGLLHGFLSVNDWPHAYILFERLASLDLAAHQQLCDGLFHTIENEIDKSYKLVRPMYLSKLGGSLDQDTSGIGEMDIKYSGQCVEFVDLRKEFFQMLSCVGPYLYRNALLLQKVCRVLRGYYSSALSSFQHQFGSIHQDVGRDARVHLKEARLRTEEALGNCLLPSLQLLPANPAVGLEIWEVMSLLPYEVRYKLYGEWEKDDERIPMLAAARQTARLDTRRILKRLAKENLKQLGRMVAKLAHANPMTVLRTIVHQIEAYKDMITPVVDAFKYLTQLEYDVLEYVVIERLAQGGRDKLKEDGLNLSDWLQSLASFWGHLCKKYPSMELRGLFQYLVNQLKKGEGIELVVLQELIQQMANVEYTENMTEEQLEAMAGSETLRYQATTIGATKNNKALLKSTNRLRDALLPKDEPKLAVPLLLLIAQYRSRVVIDANAPHIKMVSEQFDRCHGTLLQYVDFLTSAVIPATSYAQLIPTLDELLHKYHLEPEVCFLLYRPVLRLFKPLKGGNLSWPMDSGKISAQTEQNDQSSLSNGSNDLILELGSVKKPLMWSGLLSTVHSMLPPKAWTSLSPELYTTFWGLSLQDIYVPTKRYETEISKQYAALKALEESSDNSHTAIAKRKKDKEKIQEVLDRLLSELQKQEQNVNAVHQRLVKEKDSWLTSCPDSSRINMEFLQRCIFPRCVFSMHDAIFCARFVHLLHSIGTPFFNTVNHIDIFICKTLHPMVSCCTEYEASRLGRFLFETLKMIYHWKSQKEIYEKECSNKPGFATVYKDPNSPRVTFNQFVRVHWKWNSRITRVLVQCLDSTEYIEIRNALTVLTKISSVFPVVKKTGSSIEKKVSKIKGDEREDLKVLATGVAAALAARRNTWVTDEEFVMGLVELKPAASPLKTAGPASSSAVANTQVEPVSVVHAPGFDSTDKPGKASALASTLLSDTTPGKVETVSRGKTEAHPSSVKSLAPSATLAQAAAYAQSETVTKVLAPSTKHTEESSARPPSSVQGAVGTLKTEEANSKASYKTNLAESEGRSKRAGHVLVGTTTKDDSKLASNMNRLTGPNATDKEHGSRMQESSRQRTSGATASAVVNNGSLASNTASRNVADKKVAAEAPAEVKTENRTSELKGFSDPEATQETAGTRLLSKSPHLDEASSKPTDDMGKDSRVQKRLSVAEDSDKAAKRRKGDAIERTGEAGEFRTTDRFNNVVEETDKSGKRRKGGDASEFSELRTTTDRERMQQDMHAAERPRSVEREKALYEERTGAAYEKHASRERAVDRTDREHRVDRSLDKPREEHGSDRLRDKSMERFARERSVDKVSERNSFDRAVEKSREEKQKDDRGRPRYSSNDQATEQSQADDRFPMQNLPPPPPLPPNIVPQSLPANRRDDEEARRSAVRRVSPRREEKTEKKRPEDASLILIDDSKRREEDIRERKREDREIPSLKERDREKEKSGFLKEEDVSAGNSKRRRLKRDHISSSDMAQSNFGPSPPPPPPPLPTAVPAQQYDRDRERKSSSTLRSVYEEPSHDKGPGAGGRVHGKDGSKIVRRDHEQIYDRDWDDDKRARTEMKRRHHRK